MTTLNETDKLVWLEIFHLDQTDDGCYLGLADIAERCGITERTAKDSRLRLKRRGFVINRNRVDYLNDTWFATLPIPLPENTPAAPPLDLVRVLRDELDGLHLGTPELTSLISTEYRTELSTEPSTEPTEVIQEEEVGREEKKRPDFATWKADWREEMGREPTRDDIEKCAPTGTEG